MSNCIIIGNCTIMKDKGKDYISNLNEQELRNLIYDLYCESIDVREYILERC